MPLPANARWNVLYHAGTCAQTAHKEQQQINRRNQVIIRRRILKRRHDPMRHLGLDYVTAKLAEFKLKENKK